MFVLTCVLICVCVSVFICFCVSMHCERAVLCSDYVCVFLWAYIIQYSKSISCRWIDKNRLKLLVQGFQIVGWMDGREMERKTDK